jgi:hypothetical protein
VRRARLDYAARLRLLLVVAAFMVAAAWLLHGCAHTGAVVVACAERVTPELEAAAAAALARDDYEPAIAKSFAGIAACVATAAVEAAIDNARNLKLAGRPPTAPSVQTAIELHGQAWLTAHQRG